MHDVDIPVLLLNRSLEAGLQLCQAFGCNDISRWGSRRVEAAVLESLRLYRTDAQAREVLALVDPSAGEPLEVRQFSLVLRPARQAIGWRQPRKLSLWAVVGQRWAFFPALDLTLLADSTSRLQEQVEAQLLTALQRLGYQRELNKVVQLQRESGLQLCHTSLLLTLERPPRDEKPEPVLEKVTSRCGRSGPSCLFRDQEIAHLARHLSAATPRSVLLVGNSGVGKTALFHQLARDAANYRLGSTLFVETTGSRLMAGQIAFGAWQKRCQQVIDEAASRRAIVHLGNLYELSQVARHSSQPLGMAGFFAGPIASGRLLAVAECTPHQWERIEAEHPQLLQAFQQQRLEPLDAPTCAQLLTRHAPEAPPQALEQILWLHRRWGMPEHWPAPLLRFLDEIRSRRDWNQVSLAFSQRTGLPLDFLDDSRQLCSQSLRQWFESRVQAQPLAVQRVVERLAAVKAGLNRQGRPVASWLLVGPTGVGKTELARSLAEFLYQDRQRLTRLDMSEYSTAWAVASLVGVAGLDSPGVLVEKVRESPFQVILFDEIEKAHPDFFDLLLQILGDGRLTDHHGQCADFSSSLVLMTSNLGGQSFVKGSLGFRQEQREDFMQAVRAAFRPELLNRIDEILPFHPLDRQTIASLARRELDQLQLRLQATRGSLSWLVEPEVVDYLVSHGYDRRYGARPLKRCLERFVLAPLAQQLLLHPPQRPLQIVLRVREEALQLEVRAQSATAPSDTESLRQQRWAQRVSELRRRLQHIQQGPVVAELLNARARLRTSRGRPAQGIRFAQQPLLDRLQQLAGQARALEEATLLELGRGTPTRSQEEPLEQLHQELRGLVTGLYLATREHPDRVLLAIFSSWPGRLLELAQAYQGLAQARGGSARWVRLWARKGKVPAPTPEDPTPHLQRELLEQLPTRLEGLGLLGEFCGPGLAVLLEKEAGPHLFLEGDAQQLCRVEVSQAPLMHYDPNTPWMAPAYAPPEGVHRQSFFENQPRMRTYHASQRRLEDQRVASNWNWSGASLILAPWLEQWLFERALEACLP